MKLIELNNICKTYGKDDAKQKILKDINFRVEEGEMIAIMGPSGSGKSTLLNILGCLDNATDGKYFVNGEDVQKFKNKKLASIRNQFFGFVVQYFALIDDYTAFQNIKVPLLYSKEEKLHKKDLIINMMRKLGIEDKKDKYPSQLSGGQNQRVAIARALINNPKIILADEPTGALDRKNGNDVMNLFEDFNKEGKTVIIVTHDEQIAKRCSRIIKIEDGKIIKDFYSKEIIDEN